MTKMIFFIIVAGLISSTQASNIEHVVDSVLETELVQCVLDDGPVFDCWESTMDLAEIEDEFEDFDGDLLDMCGPTNDFLMCVSNITLCSIEGIDDIWADYAGTCDMWLSCTPTLEDAVGCAEAFGESMVEDVENVQDICTPTLNLLTCAKSAARTNCDQTFYNEMESLHTNICVDWFGENPGCNPGFDDYNHTMQCLIDEGILKWTSASSSGSWEGEEDEEAELVIGLRPKSLTECLQWEAALDCVESIPGLQGCPAEYHPGLLNHGRAVYDRVCVPLLGCGFGWDFIENCLDVDMSDCAEMASGLDCMGNGMAVCTLALDYAPIATFVNVYEQMCMFAQSYEDTCEQTWDDLSGEGEPITPGTEEATCLAIGNECCYELWYGEDGDWGGAGPHCYMCDGTAGEELSLIMTIDTICEHTHTAIEECGVDCTSTIDIDVNEPIVLILPNGLNWNIDNPLYIASEQCLMIQGCLSAEDSLTCSNQLEDDIFNVNFGGDENEDEGDDWDIAEIFASESALGGLCTAYTTYADCITTSASCDPADNWIKDAALLIRDSCLLIESCPGQDLIDAINTCQDISDPIYIEGPPFVTAAGRMCNNMHGFFSCVMNTCTHVDMTHLPDQMEEVWDVSCTNIEEIETQLTGNWTNIFAGGEFGDCIQDVVTVKRRGVDLHQDCESIIHYNLWWFKVSAEATCRLPEFYSQCCETCTKYKPTAALPDPETDTIYEIPSTQTYSGFTECSDVMVQAIQTSNSRIFATHIDAVTVTPQLGCDANDFKVFDVMILFTDFESATAAQSTMSSPEFENELQVQLIIVLQEMIQEIQSQQEEAAILAESDPNEVTTTTTLAPGQTTTAAPYDSLSGFDSTQFALLLIDLEATSTDIDVAEIVVPEFNGCAINTDCMGINGYCMDRGDGLGECNADLSDCCIYGNHITGDRTECPDNCGIDLSDLSAGAIAGIVIGSVVFVLIMAFISYKFCCNKNSDGQIKPAETELQ